MKKFQKLFALILAIVQLMCMMAGVAGAEYGMETGVKLGSLPLRDGIYYTVVDGRLEERQEEPGSYLLYDQQRARLVLKDFVFTLNDFTEDSQTAALFIPEDVTVELIGSNTLTNSGYYVRTVGEGESAVQEKLSNGINALDNDLIFIGDGSLTLSTCSGDDYKGTAVATDGRVTIGSATLMLEVLGAEAAFRSMPAFDYDVEADVAAGSDRNSAYAVNGFDPGAYMQPYVRMTMHKSAELLAAEEAQRQAEEAARQEAERLAAEEAARQEAERLAEIGRAHV